MPWTEGVLVGMAQKWVDIYKMPQAEVDRFLQAESRARARRRFSVAPPSRQPRRELLVSHFRLSVGVRKRNRTVDSAEIGGTHARNTVYSSGMQRD